MTKVVEYKYPEAVSLYATTRLSVKDICVRLDLPFRAFTNYLCRYHRDLILKRHGLENEKNVRLRGAKGQTTVSRRKYRDAIVAADSSQYIEYNISQIARIFGLDESGLNYQLRHHYPDVLERREKERRRLGVSAGVHHGVRSVSKDVYAPAVEMLRESDMTVGEVARMCDVSAKGLADHIACYHKDVMGERERKRRQAMGGAKVRGERTGSWTIHAPNEALVRKYAGAVDLFRSTSMTLKEIGRQCGVNHISLAAHIRQWFPELIAARRGFGADVKLSETKRYSRAATEKYAAAIDLLKNSTLSTNAVAVKLGLQPDVFRAYIKEHEPELLMRRGMTKTENGKRVGVRSSEKYAEALKIYSETPEPLKSIAKRLNLVYVTLSGYIHRNCPELIEQHNALLQSAE